MFISAQNCRQAEKSLRVWGSNDNASPIASKAQYMYINANMYDNWKQQTCFIDWDK